MKLLMSRRTAAIECDMSEAAFIKAVEAGELPKPIYFAGKPFWASHAIQRHLDGLVGDTLPNYRREFLEKIERAA